MKILFKILLYLMIPISLAGQLKPVTNQYILNPITINPGYSGTRGALNIAAFYRKQWVGIAGSPETLTLAADAPVLNSKVGLGLIIVSDKVGVSKETQITTNYAYRIKLADGNLSFGLGAGLRTTNTKWSDLVVLDQGDEYFLTDAHVFVVPDFSFGAYYTYKNYFAGISIPKLVDYNFDFNKNKYTLSFNLGNYKYLINAGYLFNISDKVNLLTSTLLTLSPDDKFLFDLNAHAIIYDRFWCGVSYRNNRSISGLFQFAINNQFKVAYTYDFDTGKLGRYSNGSHEIMLRYEFKYKVEAVNPLVF